VHLSVSVCAPPPVPVANYPDHAQPPGAIFGQPLSALPHNRFGVPDFLLMLESKLAGSPMGQEGLFRIPPPQVRVG
jgi:hypothetical protein